MKKVICVDAEDLHLTNGKEYVVAEEPSVNYLIKNNLGVHDWYNKSRFRPVPEQEFQYGQEVEAEGNIGKYVAKSPGDPMGSHIVEIKVSTGHWVLHYFSLSDIRPVQSMRDKVVEILQTLRKDQISEHVKSVDPYADRIIELVKNEKI